MPTGSSFHPARVYRVLRASFSHPGDASASFRAPRVSGAPVSRTQVFRARVPRARGNVPLSLVEFLFRRADLSHSQISRFRRVSAPIALPARVSPVLANVGKSRSEIAYLPIARFLPAISPSASPLNR